MVDGMAFADGENVEFSTQPTKQTFKNLSSDYGKIPKKSSKVIQDIAKHHIESFNWALGDGLVRVVQNLEPEEFLLPDGQTRVSLSYGSVTLGMPAKTKESAMAKDVRQFPTECRQGASSYCAMLRATLLSSVNGKTNPPIEVELGEIPVMVKSKWCHLHNLTPKQLVERNEEVEEFGGYFIVNGNEKMLRLLIQPRQNLPLAFMRSSWTKRGSLFTEYGVAISCMADDHSRALMVLHYLRDGTAKLMISFNSEMFFFPLALLLKALCNFTDLEIFEELIRGREHDVSYKGCVMTMLRQLLNEGVYNQKQALNYIGARFRNRFFLPEWKTDAERAEYLLKHHICIHLKNERDKFNLLTFMCRKLYAVVKKECAVDSADNLMHHEVLTSGSIYLVVLKQKLAHWLAMLKLTLLKRLSYAKSSFNLGFLSSSVATTSKTVSGMSTFIATGNITSKGNLGLQQRSGFSIICDRLNYLRFIAHFRCIHRGAFYATMRTTAVRKLLPEQWGFVCPVHTPDGAPCGLLNHLASTCEIVMKPDQGVLLPKLLSDMGMSQCEEYATDKLDMRSYYQVFLDGKVLGCLTAKSATGVVDQLRCMKATDSPEVSKYTEICLVPHTGKASQYPGLYIFTAALRMVRPVLNLTTQTVEYVGTFESVYLNIAVSATEVIEGVTTHMELKPTNILSILANNIPLSDFNQSPRNMYQCQMSKQTMGTPTHVIQCRSDNKLYRLITPSSPLFRPQAYDEHKLDDYPSGTNAIVAVISYTGYDMEDAMIINKASYERGFTHAAIYKNDIIDLNPQARGRPSHSTHVFGVTAEVQAKVEGFLDSDGLPIVGTLLKSSDPYYCRVDLITDKATVVKYHSSEDAFVEAVTAVGGKLNNTLQRICIRLRIPRNPNIGDKYASRHGQKGVCSNFWKQEDMPFTESGMTPDIIFNPHGFPSRMTIGMMVESMAGKSGALHGLIHDATPFRFSEDCSAIDHFGKLLEAGGYNYYGTERMYSGVDGREMTADIFFGLVYYQKLRHMVSDKFQVRNIGTIDSLTRQPVKGRKRAGGIRFGEMERDSLLAHGTSFLLQDRLFNGSDRSLEYICTKCGGLLPIVMGVPSAEKDETTSRRWLCAICDSEEHIEVVAIPFVFRYLLAELTAVNIRVVLKVK